ncbi:MAG: hypothetical protein GTO63_36915, partial [Anaerolineae bacterium]|nr:hypothetical protein [Anaerolineae bacterium]
MQVTKVTASPDTFYLHDTDTSGVTPAGKYMNTTQGSSGTTMVFNTVGQNAYWYTDTGLTTGVEAGSYTFSMYFNELPRPWWNSNYGYRININITGNADTASASGKTVRVTLNTAALVSANLMQADGDDLRIVYWNGASWVELNRQLFQMNAADTDVWFPLQATIGNGATDANYFIYYGYGSASGPPANLGTTDTLEFYSGDGDTNFQDATLACGSGSSTNYNSWGTDNQKADQQSDFSTGCEWSSNAIQVGLAEWSNFYGSAGWQVPSGARVVEDGTSSGSRIRLWGDGNTGHRVQVNAVLESWVDTQVTWNDSQTATPWTGNAGAGAVLEAPNSGNLTGFDDVSGESQVSASMEPGANWGQGGVEGPPLNFTSTASTVQRWVTGKLANNGVAIYMTGYLVDNGVTWKGEENDTATMRPRLSVVYYDHYQPEPATTLGDPWWNSSWESRKKLTFDNSAQSENLVNFPVLVELDG